MGKAAHIVALMSSIALLVTALVISLQMTAKLDEIDNSLTNIKRHLTEVGRNLSRP